MLQDGSVEIAYDEFDCPDSRGRTHGENRSVMPESSQGDPPWSGFYLDPETHLETHTSSNESSYQSVCAIRTAVRMPRLSSTEGGKFRR